MLSNCLFGMLMVIKLDDFTYHYDNLHVHYPFPDHLVCLLAEFLALQKLTRPKMVASYYCHQQFNLSQTLNQIATAGAYNKHHQGNMYTACVNMLMKI